MKHTKQKQGDDGVVIDPAHVISNNHIAHQERKKKAIQSSPDISKMIPVRIPELRATIFMRPGEDADIKIANYKQRMKNAVNTSKKKNGEFLVVEE
jgi:hypothetical protein